MSKPQDSNLDHLPEQLILAAPEEAPEATIEVAETPVDVASASAAPATESAGWVTFVGDPFHAQPALSESTDENPDADLDSDLDVELDAEFAAEQNPAEQNSEETPLSLDAAAQDYIPEETPSEQDLEQLAQLSVAMAAQNEETLASLATIAAPEMPAEDAAAPSLAEQAQNAEIAAIEAAAQAESAAPATEAEPVALDLPLDLIEAQSCIEALLFISDKPLNAEKLHAALGEATPFTLVQEALTALVDRYQGPMHGFELVSVGGGYQFRTKPGRAHLAKQLAKVQTQKLSAGAMETLALVSYKQPIMKEEIDAIRGVDSSYFIRTLMDRKLIKITGRSDLPGRPMVYGTTQEFLELFGLKDLGALPSLRELEGMVPASSVGKSEDEDPRVKQMRSLVSEMNHDVSVTLAYDPKEDDQFLSDIRDRVKQIPTTTATLMAQDAAARAAEEAQEAAEAAALLPPVEAPAPQLDV